MATDGSQLFAEVSQTCRVCPVLVSGWWSLVTFSSDGVVPSSAVKLRPEISIL